MTNEEKKVRLTLLQMKVAKHQSIIEECFQEARNIVGENEPGDYTCDFLLNGFMDVDKLLERFHGG